MDTLFFSQVTFGLFLLRFSKHYGRLFHVASNLIRKSLKRDPERTFLSIIACLGRSKNAAYSYKVLNALLLVGENQLDQSCILKTHFQPHELKVDSVTEVINKSLFVLSNCCRVY